MLNQDTAGSPLVTKNLTWEEKTFRKEELQFEINFYAEGRTECEI